jgi:hypothetical protein
MLSWPGAAIQLSELTTLSITPHEHHIVHKLDLPALTSLTISKQPGPLSASANGWLSKMVTLCKNISSLTLDRFEPMLPVFIGLYPHAPKLEALAFSHCTLEGPAICFHLKKVARETQKKLASLTFEICVGLSQQDCLLLSKTVNRLNVFRSEFIYRGDKILSNLILSSLPSLSWHIGRGLRLHALMGPMFYPRSIRIKVIVIKIQMPSETEVENLQARFPCASQATKRSGKSEYAMVIKAGCITRYARYELAWVAIM